MMLLDYIRARFSPSPSSSPSSPSSSSPPLLLSSFPSPSSSPFFFSSPSSAPALCSSSSSSSSSTPTSSIPNSSSNDDDSTAAGLSSPLASPSDYPTPPKYLSNPSLIPSYYVFQSNMVSDEDLLPGMLRNLEVDRRLTLPTRTHIRFLVTATDVIHSWAVPALGIKADAVPGRLQKVNTFIQREGVFYGQCSELCGALHAFMPIVVEAVSPETYAAHAKKWYKE